MKQIWSVWEHLMFTIRFFFQVVIFLGWLARLSDDKMTGNTKSIWCSLINLVINQRRCMRKLDPFLFSSQKALSEFTLLKVYSEVWGFWHDKKDSCSFFSLWANFCLFFFAHKYWFCKSCKQTPPPKNKNKKKQKKTMVQVALPQLHRKMSAGKEYCEKPHTAQYCQPGKPVKYS